MLTTGCRISASIILLKNRVLIIQRHGGLMVRTMREDWKANIRRFESCPNTVSCLFTTKMRLPRIPFRLLVFYN